MERAHTSEQNLQDHDFRSVLNKPTGQRVEQGKAKQSKAKLKRSKKEEEEEGAGQKKKRLKKQKLSRVD